MLFGNDTYFNAAFLEKRLNEVLKIFTKGGAVMVTGLKIETLVTLVTLVISTLQRPRY